MVVEWKKMQRFVSAVEAFEASSSDAYALALVLATVDVGRYFVELAPVDVLLAKWRTLDAMVDEALRDGDVDGAEAIGARRDRAAFETAEAIVRRLNGVKDTPSFEPVLRASLKKIEQERASNVVPLRKDTR